MTPVEKRFPSAWDWVNSRGPGRPGQLTPLKIWSLGQKLHMALMSDECQSNGNYHLSNFVTIVTTCLHSHTAVCMCIILDKDIMIGS